MLYDIEIKDLMVWSYSWDWRDKQSMHHFSVEISLQVPIWKSGKGFRDVGCEVTGAYSDIHTYTHIYMLQELYKLAFCVLFRRYYYSYWFWTIWRSQNKCKLGDSETFAIIEY